MIGPQAIPIMWGPNYQYGKIFSQKYKIPFSFNITKRLKIHFITFLNLNKNTTFFFLRIFFYYYYCYGSIEKKKAQ